MKDKNQRAKSEADYEEELLSGSVAIAMKKLEGYLPFEELLEALQQDYLFHQTVSPNGDQAMRVEGERGMLIHLINLYREIKNV